MRLTILDGFRGYFLLFMMIAHAAGTLNAPIGLFSHHSIGWVEDAQGFVFVSGLVVGMVYGKRLIRKGYATMFTGIIKRVGTLYRYQAALILGFLVLALTCAAFGEVPQVIQSYAAEPVVFPIISLMLIGSSMHMGILPMYIFYLLATPLVLWAFKRGHAPAVMILSVMLWLLAQTLLFDKIQYPIEALLADAGHPVNIGIYFDVFAWQLLYFSGLYLGWLVASDRLDLSVMKTPTGYSAFLMGVAAFAALAVFDWTIMGNWMGDEYSAMFSGDARAMLAPIYVIAFFLDLFLVTWLVVAGRRVGSRIVRAAANGLEWLMTRPALTLLGRHSLEVFVVHVVITYALAIWAEGRSFEASTANLLVLVSLLPLYAVAWAREERGKRRAVLAAKA